MVVPYYWKMKFAGILFITALIVSAAHSQSTPKVVSGPMPGYTTMNEVGVWLQLDGEADVQLDYWKVNANDLKHSTPSVHTSQKSAFTASFVLANLEPGQTYRYRVKHNDQDILNGEELVLRTQSFWQYRTDPPSFKLALGSCAYINEEGFDRPGKAYGSGYEIFNRIADQAPDLMLWLGDNIYLREPDWGSRSGYLHRYSHSRAIPELQRLLRTTHHYAIWDDHDFGPNDANGSWPYKMWALESFNLFWMNPPVTPGLQGITTSFRYNDIDMFLLDNRWYRTPDDLITDDREMLGEDQLDWFIQALKYSNAPFKLVAVGGQILNTAKVYECYANYETERATLLRRIEEEDIQGVIFLTGDRHHTELSKIEGVNGNVMYDLTVSPLTSGVHNEPNEPNTLRVDTTLVMQHNFALLEFSGARKSRVLTIKILDDEGKVIWTQAIDQPQRKP